MMLVCDRDEREKAGPRWLSNVLSLQHREPFLRRCASKFGHPRLQFSARRSYVGGCKMGFNSTYWHERAGEMRKIADQTPDRHARETMLGIAHDLDLLVCRFEALERWQNVEQPSGERGGLVLK